VISFTDKKLYVKGTCQAQLSDPCTGDIVYASNKFQTANITTSVTMGEIRGGMGNAVAAILPSDSALNVEFTAADFSLAAKAAQLGATLSYGAPVSECQTVTATGSSLTIDVTTGAPVAPVGFAGAIAYVQEIGAAGTLSATGKAYPITATGVVTGFSAANGRQYKVYYFVNSPTAQMATISSLFDPKVLYFQAQMPVFSNESCAGENEGTRVGWLYVIVPRLKLGANGGVVGDATNPDTTSVSGQAVAFDETVVSAECSDCEAGKMAYYIYVPDNGSDSIVGLALVGGLVSIPTSSTMQIPVRFVMENGQLVAPSDYKTGFTYTLDGAPTGTSVSDSGVITAGSTAGEFEIVIRYDIDATTGFMLGVNAEVTVG
jgi:hypothetical protein